MHAENLWTHDETAAYLKLAPQTLYYLNHKGKGPARHKVGRYCRYDPAEVKRWIRARKVDGWAAPW
ncbi:helix-turn-helix transcriptional regulator [Actinoplanes sp. NPDC051859]|uniref:helix-turn-helix transcriptional regulator n=1 Tax=Actinoplanes sp. NPDC051859 TaxID=3363909 RepID=UPI0037BBA440